MALERSDPLARALALVESLVAEGTRDGHDELPTLRELAIRAEVGQSTMYKAATVLRERCAITTAEGRGMRILRLSDVQRKAVDFLLEHVAHCRRERVPRLPTVAQLASMAGVSLATMAKAVGRAKDAGVVETTAGSGIYLPGLPQQHAATERPVAPAPDRTQKWEQVERRISQDLLGGVYPAGLPLPSPKELGARYGVCGKTLQKALLSLAQRKRIVRDRARFLVSSPEGGRGRNTVMLIARGTPEGELFRLSSRTITNLRWLENECSRNGLQLVVVTHNDMRTVLLGPIRRTVSFAEALRRENVLGFVVWTMGLGGSTFGLDNLLLEIAGHRRPVAVLDEGGELPRSLRGLSSPVKAFTTGGGPVPGRKVARYLISLGHRRVAWISPHASNAWSQQRLEGLREEFAAAGIADGVVEICDDVVRRPPRRPIREQATSWDAEQLLGMLGVHSGGTADVRIAQRTLRSLESQLWVARISQELREQTEPLFTRALGAHGVSAWVGANDEVAVHGIDFLQARGRRVPDQLSVVGFDNSNDSTVRGLTTYNFNISGIMHAMVSFVLDPRLDPWDAQRDSPVEIEGFVTERVTTGRRAEGERQFKVQSANVKGQSEEQ